MNIDELEKLAREAHDPDFPWIDRDALIGGLFAKGEIDYIAAAKPAAILELIDINRELVAALKWADDQLVLWQGEPNEFSCAIHYVVMGNIRDALARANGGINEWI